MNEFVVEAPAEAAPAPVDPGRALLLPLWRARYLVLVAVLLGAAGGLCVGLVRPNTYRSVGKLMIRWGAREEVTPEMSVTGNAGGVSRGAHDAVNDELHLLDTPQVFEETARIVTPAEVLRPYEPGAQDNANTPLYLATYHRLQSWWFSQMSDDDERPNHHIDQCAECIRAAALVLGRNLVLTAEPASDVISVSYATHDPELARKVVTAFLEASIAHHRSLHETNATLEFLGHRLSESLEEVRTAENEFTTFRAECGVFDYDSQQRGLIEGVHELEGLTAQDLTHIEELRARANELKQLLTDIPATIEERVEHNLQPNPDRAVLKQRVFSLEDALAALERRVGGSKSEKDAEREQIAHSLTSAQTELEKQPEFIDAGAAVRKVPNARHERLTQQLDDAVGELASLEAAASMRRTRLSELRERELTTGKSEPRYRFLEATAQKARTRYEHFRSAQERASLMSLMDQLEMSNLRRIQEPTLPSEKEGPRRGKLLMLGVLLGLVAGAGLAFAKNTLDRRLHDAAEVEQLLGTAVLGVVPLVRVPLRSRWRAPRRAAL